MNDNFQIIKDSIPFIPYVERHGGEVKREGVHHKARCIFHDDHDPSLVLYPDSYHCFACHASGDVIDYAMKLNNWDKATALAELAHEYNITLTPLSPDHAAKQGRRERLYALMADAAEFYHAVLFQSVGQEALIYAKEERGFSVDTIKAAQIGYASWYGKHLLRDLKGYTDDELIASGMVKKGKFGDLCDTFSHRIMIPIRDHKGRVVAFSGRALDKDQTPKYLHNAKIENVGIFDKSKIIHRMPLNRSTMALDATGHTIVVVEGTLDPVSALNQNIHNIASLLGKSMSDEQLLLLCAPGVTRLVFCLDNDTAGHDALKRLVVKHMYVSASKGVDLYAMQAPHGKDPDDTFREASHLWQPAVDAARPVVDVLLERESISLPKDPTPGQKQAWGVKLLPLLKGENGFVNEDNIKRLSSFLGSSVETIEAWTRTHAVVMPKFTPAPTIDRSLPTNEEWVLHAIITQDDDYLLERLNASLDTVTSETLPYALGPLSLNDFTTKETRAVMAQIQIFIASNDRPLYASLAVYFEGGNNQVMYERIARADARSVILSGPGAISRIEAVQAAFYVRIARLENERINLKDEAMRQECINAIVYLRLKLEDLVS